MTPQAPGINWEALSPLLALTGGACLVLLVGLLRARFARRHLTPGLALVALGTTAGLCVWQWGVNTEIVERALAIDDLTLLLTLVFVVGGIATVLLSWRSAAAAEAGEGEFYALLLTSVLGMVVLVAAQNLVVLFLGFELLSIPLYVLCATHMRREQSLESGLKYLIIGSVGSATLLYGLAFLYGAAGTTDYAGIAEAATDDVLLFTGIALVVAGLAFKASVAPFHQWTPDVYEGAPTAVTGFMAVATKAAAFGVLLRLFDGALISPATTLGPAPALLPPATVGFFGKVYLIEAAVNNDYGWLGVAIVIGSAISLVYYLRVIAAVWMRSPSEAVAVRPGRVPGGRPTIAGWSQEADAEVVVAPRRHRQPELVFVA